MDDCRSYQSGRDVGISEGWRRRSSRAIGKGSRVGSIEADIGGYRTLKGDAHSPASIRGFADLTEAADISLSRETVQNR
jgi:hypothetical protein